MSDKPVETPKEGAQDKTPDFNVDELHKEIEAANKKIVSEDVAQLLAKEREEARKEAQKEFAVNQQIKDKEAELENMKKAQKEKDLENARQLEALKRKVDELAASKQPVQVQNPFGSPSQSKDAIPSVLSMKEEDLDEMEKASFEALLARKNA